MFDAAARARSLDTARWAVRLVERFVFRELGAAASREDEEAARNVQRLAVGLRRMLDNYRAAQTPDGGPHDAR